MPARTVQATIDDCIERAFVAGADHFAIWGAGIDSAKADRVVKAVLKRGGSDSTLRLIQREAREAIMEAAIRLAAARELDG